MSTLQYSINFSFFHFSTYLQFSETGNQTLSVLTFIPVVDDDGKYLTCRAENPYIPDSAIEDKWRLVVHCKFFCSIVVDFVCTVIVEGRVSLF